MEKKKPRQLHGFDISKMMNDSTDPIIDKTLSDGFNKTIKGVTEHRDTKSIQPQLGGQSFQDKIKSLTGKGKKLGSEMSNVGKMVGKKALGALPLIGGLAAAAKTGDVMAAVPMLDSADDVGESAEAEKMMLAEDQARRNYENSPARQGRLQAMGGEETPEEEQLRFQKIRQMMSGQQ